MSKIVRVTVKVEFYYSENPAGHFGDPADVAWREPIKAEEFTVLRFHESVQVLAEKVAEDLLKRDLTTAPR